MQKMRVWARFQLDNGMVQEALAGGCGGPPLAMDVGVGRVMGDVSSVWLLELVELFQHTGDLALLKELYQHVPWAASWMVRVYAAATPHGSCVV